ncbi:uncharacterized protein WM294_003227 isoform 2-T3 [Sarcoramphus papa]
MSHSSYTEPGITYNLCCTPWPQWTSLASSGLREPCCCDPTKTTWLCCYDPVSCMSENSAFPHTSLMENQPVGYSKPASRQNMMYCKAGKQNPSPCICQGVTHGAEMNPCFKDTFSKWSS